MSWLRDLLELFGLRDRIRPRPQAPTSFSAPPTVPLSAPIAWTKVRVTDERDPEPLPRMYSYWSNACIKGDAVYVFAGFPDGQVRFFRVRPDGSVDRLGPLVSYAGTGEGWYFDAEAWLYLLDGPRLRHVNPFTGEDVIVFEFGDPTCRLWQSHSSDDGRVHSATVQRIVESGAYPNIGTVVCRDGQQTFYPAVGALDESHLTANGEWLIIEEGNDNRIIHLPTGDQKWVANNAGALSHIDCGPRYMVGEDDIRGACVYVDLELDARRVLFETWGMGHVSVRAERCLLSDARAIGLVDLDAGGVRQLLEHGMVGEGYDYQVKANLDPSGQVACYMSNEGRDRQDVFLLRID